MLHSMLLAEELAKAKLEKEFVDEKVIAAFENDDNASLVKRYSRSFGGALELLTLDLGQDSTIKPMAVWLLQVFDRAGMTKEEMGEAIWNAAEHYYKTELKSEEG